MRKIAKKMTKRRGFTLIEILLVLAIMVMFISIIFSTFYLVNASHANVVVINDARDFAALNMEAISKLVVNAEYVVLSSDSNTNKIGYTNIYYNIDAGPTYNDLYIKNTGVVGSPVFSYADYKVSGGGNKWRIQPTFTPSGTMLTIKLEVFDNASGSATPYYTLTRTVLLPNVLKSSQFTVTSAPSSVITF